MSRQHREQDMITDFGEITGASRDSGRFFLESTNWNLELALANFYETIGNSAYTSLPFYAGERGQDHGRDEDLIEQETEELNEEEIEAGLPSENNSPAVISSPTSTTNPCPPRSRFATISTLRAQESSSDEEEGQAYYAGGSEHSGQQVVGPSRPSHEIITDMFRSIRDQGGVEAISHEPGGTQFFSGQGYRLGQSVDDTQVVNTGGGTRSSSDTHREVVLRLWRDGFNVDNGPLRSYNDPQEREFLARIRKGNVPAELFPHVEGGAVHLSLEDHRHENFIASVAKPAPFTGQGHVLGSALTESPSADENEGNTQTAEKTVSKPNLTINIDNNQPTTTIQVRLPDGDRAQFTLNHSHTIADLRTAIMEQYPRYSEGDFTLITTFPRRELSNFTSTLVDADILNSSLLLRH